MLDFRKNMNTRRKMTPTEQTALVLRLEEQRSSIEESYEYSLEGLIDYLKHSTRWRKNEVEEEFGNAVRYYLHFSSPADAWEMMCGRAGIYTVDATSLQAIEFELIVMN